MKELWGFFFMAPGISGAFNSSRIPPTPGGMLPATSPRGAETPPPPTPLLGDKFGGFVCVWGMPRRDPGALTNEEIPGGSQVRGWGWGGTSHAPSCTPASPPPRRAGHPSPKRLWKVPGDISLRLPVPYYPVGGMLGHGVRGAMGGSSRAVCAQPRVPPLPGPLSSLPPARRSIGMTVVSG